MIYKHDTDEYSLIIINLPLADKAAYSPCGPRVRESSVSLSVGNGKRQSGHLATVIL